MKVKEIKPKTKFCEAAKIILLEKYNKFDKKVVKYLNDNSIENLHKLRISVRRYRYSLENFVLCFHEKDCEYVLSSLKELQDLLGKERDIDVMKEILNEFNYLESNSNLKNRIETEKTSANKELIKRLKHIHSDIRMKEFILK